MGNRLRVATPSLRNRRRQVLWLIRRNDSPLRRQRLDQLHLMIVHMFMVFFSTRHDHGYLTGSSCVKEGAASTVRNDKIGFFDPVLKLFKTQEWLIPVEVGLKISIGTYLYKDRLWLQKTPPRKSINGIQQAPEPLGRISDSDENQYSIPPYVAFGKYRSRVFHW